MGGFVLAGGSGRHARPFRDAPERGPTGWTVPLDPFVATAQQAALRPPDLHGGDRFLLGHAQRPARTLLLLLLARGILLIDLEQGLFDLCVFEQATAIWAGR